MGVFDYLKTAHSFVTDGYQRYKKFKDIWSGLTKKEVQIGDLIKRAGVKVDNLKDIHDQEGGWNGLFRKLVGSEDFQHSLLTGLGEAATALATEGFTPAAGAAIALSGSEWLQQRMHKGGQFYRKGDWVLIDDGVETLPSGMKQTLEWGEGEMFGEEPEPWEIDLETEHLVSVGFVTEPNADDGMVAIFNLEYGEARQYRKQDLSHLDSNRANALQANADMEAIKAFVLDPEAVAQRLSCEVPCDPGEEVEYEGDMYRIVTCNGTTANIENGNNSLQVKMSWLTRGRVDHTNSWNYQQNGETPTGFDRDIKPRLYKSQWVWLPVRSKGLLHYPEALKELGVVRLINGDTLDGYYCSDGARFQVHLDMVHALKEERQEWLNRHADFKRFQQKAVIGNADVRAFSLGTVRPLLCFGLAKLTPVLTHGSVEEGHIVAGATQGALLLTKPKEGDTTKGQALEEAVEQPKESPVVTVDGRASVPDTEGYVGEDPFPQKSKKEETNSIALVACAVGIGALVLWSTT